MNVGGGKEVKSRQQIPQTMEDGEEATAGTRISLAQLDE